MRLTMAHKSLLLLVLTVNIKKHKFDLAACLETFSDVTKVNELSLSIEVSLLVFKLEDLDSLLESVFQLHLSLSVAAFVHPV